MPENFNQKTKRPSSQKMEETISKRRKTEEKSNSRMIKLYCPAASKIAEIMAWEDQRLDLGAIARTFGLDPATLKLNGHFISRGVDLIASSVTWKSLFSFFSCRGLSTGFAPSGALIVDGKLSKSGTKRMHESGDVENDIHGFKPRNESLGGGRNRSHEVINSPNYKKLKESTNGRDNSSQMAKCGDDGLKRKHWLENISSLKRTRANGSYSYEISPEHVERGHMESSITQLHCGYQLTANMKRLREEEVVMAGSCKRTR